VVTVTIVVTTASMVWTGDAVGVGFGEDAGATYAGAEAQEEATGAGEEETGAGEELAVSPLQRYSMTSAVSAQESELTSSL